VVVEGNDYFKIKHPAVMNYKIRIKETTVEHNFIKYSRSYMFRLLLISSKSQSDDDTIGPKHITE